MKTIKEMANEYVSPETKNITELDKVSVEMAVEVKTFTDSKGKDFDVNVIVVKDEEYRVPNSVLKQLKVQQEENPNLAYFKVKSQGNGLNTQYTVIPLTE